MKIFKKFMSNNLCGHGEAGVTLLEAIVTIGILGAGLITMVLAMSGGALAVGENTEEAEAQNLARSQMEYIKSCPYVVGATTYPAIDTPSDYSISVIVTTVPDTDTDIQKITANIYHEDAQVMSITDYKMNR
jgi:Tfp pilus assembly protein PilV